MNMKIRIANSYSNFASSNEYSNIRWHPYCHLMTISIHTVHQTVLIKISWCLRVPVFVFKWERVKQNYGFEPFIPSLLYLGDIRSLHYLHDFETVNFAWNEEFIKGNIQCSVSYLYNTLYNATNGTIINVALDLWFWSEDCCYMYFFAMDCATPLWRRGPFSCRSSAGQTT